MKTLNVTQHCVVTILHALKTIVHTRLPPRLNLGPIAPKHNCVNTPRMETRRYRFGPRPTYFTISSKGLVLVDHRGKVGVNDGRQESEWHGEEDEEDNFNVARRAGWSADKDVL